uniref:Arrestin_N domain-containing protein n=1 Tax=Steinernema glaseri TaxID=37863 RepID=A0A1I7Y3X9_9BILA
MGLLTISSPTEMSSREVIRVDLSVAAGSRADSERGTHTPGGTVARGEAVFAPAYQPGDLVQTTLCPILKNELEKRDSNLKERGEGTSSTAPGMIDGDDFCGRFFQTRFVRAKGVLKARWTPGYDTTVPPCYITTLRKARNLSLPRHSIISYAAPFSFAPQYGYRTIPTPFSLSYGVCTETFDLKISVSQGFFDPIQSSSLRSTISTYALPNVDQMKSLSPPTRPNKEFIFSFEGPPHAERSITASRRRSKARFVDQINLSPSIGSVASAAAIASSEEEERTNLSKLIS